MALLSGTCASWEYRAPLAHAVIGCERLVCPLESANSTTTNCTIVDKTYTTIGQGRVPFVSNSSLYGLSWVEGVAVTDHDDNRRTFEKNFYLGTPSYMDTSGLVGCAIFFTAVNRSQANYGGAWGETVMECPDFIGIDCVDALSEQARSVDISGLGTEEACIKVKDEISHNLNSACAASSYVGRDGWTNLTVKALTGPTAPSYISSSENSTSNCWPITPQQDNLTLVESITVEGNRKRDDILWNFFNPLPVLTVFFPGNSSLIMEAESQLTCMKTINRNNATPPGINHSLPFVGGSSKAWMQASQGTLFLLLFCTLAVII